MDAEGRASGREGENIDLTVMARDTWTSTTRPGTGTDPSTGVNIGEPFWEMILCCGDECVLRGWRMTLRNPPTHESLDDPDVGT